MKRLVITDWCHERIRQIFLADKNAGACETASACPSDIPDSEGQGKERSLFIDATAGAGKDTLFLCELLGEAGGEVLAMDIQELALAKTKRRLEAAGYVALTAADIAFSGNVPELESHIGSETETPDKIRATDGAYRAELCDATGKKRVRLALRGHEHMDEYFPAETVDLILFNLGYLPGGDHSLATKADTTIPALTKALSLLRPGGLLSLMIYSGGDSGFEERDRVLAWLRELDPQRYLVLVEAFYNRPNNPPLPVFVRKLF